MSEENFLRPKQLNLKNAKIISEKTEDGIELWKISDEGSVGNKLISYELNGSSKTRSKDKKNRDPLVEAFLEEIIVNQDDIVFNINLQTWRPEEATETIKARKHQNVINDSYFQVTGISERGGKYLCNVNKYQGTRVSSELKSFKRAREDNSEALMNWIKLNGVALKIQK